MIDELAARRWKMKKRPDDHSPKDALLAIVRDIDAGALNPRHIIVVYDDFEEDQEDNDGGKVGFYQAGKIDGYYGALGLLTRALQIMGNGE